MRKIKPNGDGETYENIMILLLSGHTGLGMSE
jgi:hypothetical protein